MTHSVQDWRIDLIVAHPRLFHAPTDRPEEAQGYPTCEAGWQDLLKTACARIEAALVEGGSFRVLQIKEKFGTLRFYWRGTISDATRARVEEAIALSEGRSACTCEICGGQGRLYNHGGGLAMACAEHAKGEPVPIKPGHENLHIVWKFVPGQFRIVSCRRYIRDSDSFVDVDPKSIGIEG
jgi:hypothetical protein